MTDPQSSMLQLRLQGAVEELQAILPDAGVLLFVLTAKSDDFTFIYIAQNVVMRMRGVQKYWK